MDKNLVRKLRLEYEQRQKDQEFLKQVKKEGGFQVSQFRDYIQGLDVENKEKMGYLAREKDFRDSGLVQNDIPIEFNDFKKVALSQQKYPIRKQLWESMNDEQRKTYLSNSHPALYNDSHLERLNEKQIYSELEKTMVDIEANRENLKPFYKETDEQSIYYKNERVDRD